MEVLTSGNPACIYAQRPASLVLWLRVRWAILHLIVGRKKLAGLIQTKPLDPYCNINGLPISLMTAITLAAKDKLSIFKEMT